MAEPIKIRAVIILDVVGRPKEHLMVALEGLLEKMDAEKGITIISKNIKEPTELKNKKGFWTTFAEVEIETEDILYLTVILFKYMPAHIEIISPELLALTNNGWNDVLNELTRRLHGYDEIARIMQMEKQILENKIKDLGGKVPMTPLAKKEDFPEEVKKMEAKKKRQKEKEKKSKKTKKK